MRRDLLSQSLVVLNRWSHPAKLRLVEFDKQWTALCQSMSDFLEEGNSVCEFLKAICLRCKHTKCFEYCICFVHFFFKSSIIIYIYIYTSYLSIFLTLLLNFSKMQMAFFETFLLSLGRQNNFWGVFVSCLAGSR